MFSVQKSILCGFVLSSLFLGRSGAGLYSDQIPEIKKTFPDVIVAANNYMIAIEQKKIAVAAWTPRLEIQGNASYSQSEVQGNPDHFFSMLGGYLTFSQPIFDIERWYAVSKSKKSMYVSELQKKSMDQQFLMIFADGLLRVSEAKSRYYFSKQNFDYFLQYFEKEKAREKKEFEAANPGREFNWKKSLLLLTLDQEVRSGKRRVDSLLADFVSEKTAFEVNFLGREMKELELVNPFVKRKALSEIESSVAIGAAHSNLGIKIAEAGVELTDIALQEARKLRWPQASLFARTGINASRSAGTSDTVREDMVGVQITIPVWDLSIKPKQEAARLGSENARQGILNVKAEVELKARQLYQRIDLAVKNIESLIDDFEASKAMIDIFLDDSDSLTPEEQLVEPASNADRRLIMSTHFSISSDLAQEQHVYLQSLLQLEFLRGRLSIESFSDIEDRYFKSCKDYENFVKLAEITE